MGKGLKTEWRFCRYLERDDSTSSIESLFRSIDRCENTPLFFSGFFIRLFSSLSFSLPTFPLPRQARDTRTDKLPSHIELPPAAVSAARSISIYSDGSGELDYEEFCVAMDRLGLGVRRTHPAYLPSCLPACLPACLPVCLRGLACFGVCLRSFLPASASLCLLGSLVICSRAYLASLSVCAVERGGDQGAHPGA